jgi:signal transduction histidine kinase
MFLHVDLMRGASDRSHDVLRSELDRIDALVHAWLDAGGPRSELRTIEVPSLVEAACARSDGRARAGDCDPVVCELDDDAIAQALDELVHNGLAAARTVEIVARATDGELFLTVRDDGPGLPDGELARIGLVGATRGIGLIIARHVARSHGGSLLARRQGGYTEVSLRLPIV